MSEKGSENTAKQPEQTEIPERDKGSAKTVKRAPRTAAQPAAELAAGEGEEARMEKIRALLFGSQMRDYDRRFSELGERFREELERLRQDQNARITKLESSLRAEIERILEQNRQERQERLGAQSDTLKRIESLEQDLQARLEALDDRLSKEALALRGEMREQSGEQSDALHRARSDLADALERERLRLQDEKTGREELAQLFSELALRLNREFQLPGA